MKKAKKLISLLLALTMLLSMIPMAVAAGDAADDVATYSATPEVKIIRSTLDGHWVNFGTVTNPRQGKSESASYTQAVGEQDNYQLLPISTVNGNLYSPVAYYVPQTGSVTVSNDGIIDDLSFSMEPYYRTTGGFYDTPSLQFNFKAVAAGSTTVKVTYYYNFNVSNVVNGKEWYKSVSTFSITVRDEQVQKPDKPTESDLNRFHNRVNTTSTSEGAVYMWCGESLYDHGAWFDYLTEVPGAYTLGEVTANDGSVMSAINYPWTCTMTIDANKYLEAYNSELAGKVGQHYLKENEPEFRTVTWYYRAGEYKWKYIANNAPIYINITHDKPVTEETYVLHYNANGGKDAPASQTTKSNTGKATFTVSSAIPTRDGYTFLGWADDADATVVQYHGGDKITLTKDNPTKTIYAVWKENPPLDIPNPNPGNIAESLKVKVVCTTTNSGHDPAFYSLIDGTFTYTAIDQSGDYPTCSITISPDKYISRYSTDKNCQHTTPDDPKTVPLFWNKEAQKWAVNDGQIGLNGVVFNAVCEAVPDTFTVTYTDGVDGEEVFADQVYSGLRKDSETPAFNGTPNREGYTFAGWEPEVAKTVTETVIYVAMWTPAEPKAPTADELKKLEMAVQVKCVVDDSQQHTAAYGLLGEYDEDYFVDEPRKAGDDWLCDISYYPERYVAAFNTTFQNLKHVQNDEKIVPVTLIWAGDSWQLKEQGRVPVTEVYTVTYTDGVENEEVFADQVYSDLRKDSATPAFNGTPTRTGYTFAGWEPEVAETVTETVTYAAMWTPVEPKAPTADELKKLEMAVQVKCVVDASQQHTAAYDLLGEYDEDYFVGEPRKDGDDWLCDINYYPERYVAEFNTTFQNLKHVQNDEKIVPVTLIWAGDSWQLKEQGRVPVTEVYTVTYTDGVENEEVFADQVYSDLRKDSATPAFNGTPTRTGYTFAGWEPEVAETVTANATYTAKWTPVEPTREDIFKALNGLVTVTCINRFWKDGNKNMDCGQGQYAAKAGIAGQDYTLVKGENAGTWVVTFPVTNFVKSFKQDPAHNLYTKDTLSWYIRWEDNAWTSEPVESGVDDLVKLTHAPTDWREVAKIATGGKSDCIHTSCVNGETGVCDYGITVPFVYFNTDVVSVEPEDGVPGSYIATFKVDRYIDTCAKACNDKNFPDAPRTHKLLTQETVQWRLYATPEADEKIGNNVLNHVWEAEPVEAGKDDVCTIAHNWVVTFNPDNGEPAFTQNVEYEGKATEPAPEKTGYTFDGWYLDEAEEPFDFDTIITSDITLTAKWHVTPHNIYAYARLNSYFAPLTTNEFDTPVTLNEATLSRLGLGSYNSLGYISIGSFTFDAMPLTDDQYFGDDAELSAVAEKLATDIALETGVSDKIAEKIAWTVLYKTVNEEDMAPGYPAEAGYQLSGNLNLASVTFRAGAENVENMPAVNYTYDDGAIDFYDFYFAGDTITLPTTEPTREGYSFKGWSVEVIPAENDADHLDADGADDAADETLLKAGDTYTITAGGVIFTAQWEARTDTPYTVEHYLENLDGSYALDTTEPLKGTTDTTVTAAAKSYDNFTYDSTVPGTVASGNIAGDGSLVLKLFYTRNTYDYTVRHIKQLPDGSYDEANAEVETLSGKFEALAAVTAKDYGSHYPTNDAGTKQNIKIEKNLTIDVKYDLDNHTLTFETNGGSAIDPVTVRHGNAVARPADPTKDKYTFIGWYADPEFTEEYDFATVLEADKTIYAKFELTSTPIGDIYVRYDVLHIKQLPDGSYDLANAEVEHLSAKKDTTVTAVVKDYRATHHINVNSTLSKLTDTAIQPYPGADGKPVYTILSVYYDLDFHTLTFDTMGGSRIDPVTVRHGNAVAKPKDPVNGGYIFDGWYTDKTYRTPYNFATVLTQDTTIYAKWFLIALPGVTIKKTTPKLNTSDHFAYVQGYPDGTVKPTGNITRAETAAILFRLMDEGSRKTYYSTKSGFRDVATGSWYNTYVATLNNAGVITDSSNGYFRPNEAITRAELAAMLANFTETAGAANYFNDVSARYWAANAIAICAKLGWITGYPDGSFRPDRNVTRAELMAMINRATGRAPKSADAFLPGMKTWSDNTADKWYYLDVQEATNSHSYTVKDSEKWTALNADPNWSLYE